MKRRKPLHDLATFSTKVILSLPRRLLREQTTFKATGGLHACALFDGSGKFLAMREDVGRIMRSISSSVGRFWRSELLWPATLCY